MHIPSIGHRLFLSPALPLLALGLLASSAQAAQTEAKSVASLPIAPGQWVVKKSGCKDSQALFFEFQGKAIRFKDFNCDIKEIRHYGGIRYLLDLGCSNHSLQFDDTIALDINRDKKLFLHYPNIGSNNDEFVLCKKLRKAEQPLVAAKESGPRARLNFTSEYQGQVGKSSVKVKLSYYHDDSVIGEYVTQLLGNVYQLQGDNRQDGVLQFKEYTNGRHTANVELHKTVRDGKLAWAGKMHNLDGRIVDVVFIKLP
ncbi:hypothetical protein D5125_10010 [Magnetovirga frankeli]|uniref:hypothetical protein n=1 Tax=Magnetovirga frankeli TaxID=947516 RepID=UPI001293AC67|nr:hypothetical protein D5125_10010 [gamma proteobacterium SS-5]